MVFALISNMYIKIHTTVWGKQIAEAEGIFFFENQ